MIDSKALKEAVINAIVHSDYTYNTSPIVELYSDRIEITSGGRLPQELSQEEFLEGVTAPRNKELIKVFKDVDLIGFLLNIERILFNMILKIKCQQKTQ